MMKQLMTGNEAAAEAAIVAGCRYYYGYPITPQNELINYMSMRMPQIGGSFIQAESEIAAINMVYGSAAAGARAMTSSSSPGISLKQEGISYLAGSELPCVIVNIQRGGPGLGDISASQADYFQAVKGGGHGDYHTIVLAPSSVQEMADLVYDAFDLADKYRNPVMILGDAQIGQLMEPMEFHKRPKKNLPQKTWSLTGAEGRKRNIVKSFYPVKGQLEEFNAHLQRKYKAIEEHEVRYETVNTHKADIVLVAYGTSARVCADVVRKSRQLEFKVGLIRPITLWPFPKEIIRKISEKVQCILTVEMSAGQMVEDVRLAVEGKCPVHFYGRTGGGVPTSTQVIKKIVEVVPDNLANTLLQLAEVR
ncbi:MAG: 3-methyl-2-oxobutanoate dehydrogenase subunit VorB [Planctomycetia bacterium]|uniref:3-methyl-2-oxobutanoate dehydrogenase subunit VorB n=1 Tax=Candidatus Brocadia sapporoensis TaxID=392547 RepID=A0A1V6M1Y4_9BACT|nr:3-methyl-2-oxobutanoate dehydrogenase subunit VorB [Candidatus Brocadia sp.]OQD46377.1 3-methyl-2-oxobutanoate dehydrogenase subunit VorB [Candidatus Brocadia sapporoensis]QOJ07422.1 MAG: 3-methyl-2-oxobutanoate dehydrogenase subunit VorB [Planctomycetia bacterium]TVL95551.1 MAG: 3-methyl-2-oxobutanoate dehydrogenase subunit VorB [Candidatus Brocadia sp. BL1]